MESKYHPYVFCPWCSTEIVPFEVSYAKEVQEKVVSKLAKLQIELASAIKTIQKFEQERIEFHKKKSKKQVT